MLKLCANNAHEAAARLLNMRDEPKLHLLPFNRFNIDGDNTWWLAPTTEKAAFRHGKLICSSRIDDPPCGQVLCGLQIEKGYGTAAGGKESETFGPKWRWHRWVADLRSGAAIATFDDAISQADEPLRVFIAAYPINGNEATETFQALVEPGGTLSAAEYTVSTPPSLIDGLTTLKSIADLGHLLGDDFARNTQWHWVDVYFGLRVELCHTAADDAIKCLAILRPMERWVL